MADGSGFDPCECIYGHESAMQRLLNMLRQSQAYCTDTGCVTDLPGPQAASPSATDGGMTLWMIFFGWLLVVTAMYFMGLGPRRRPAPEGKDRDSLPENDRDNHEPPAVL
jgi:hypothetical protein